MTVREEIHQLIDALDDAQTLAVLDYLHRLSVNGNAVRTENPTSARPEVEIGDEGNKLGRPTSKDDPLWNIVGMVGQEYDGPTDVASNKHKYLAEIYAERHEE